MKIAFVISGMGRGGGERVVSVFANQFTKLGNEVTIIITGKTDESVYDLHPEVKIINLHKWIESNPLKNDSMYLRLKKKLRKHFKAHDEFDRMFHDYQYLSKLLSAYLQKQSSDYAISFLAYDNMSLALCSNKQKAKVIICEGTYPDRPEYTEVFKKVRNKCYTYADVLVFQTEYQRDCFPKKIRKNSYIIGNPIIGDLPIRNTIKREKTIVNFCRIDRPKNLFLLIDAFSEVAKEYPDYCLKIYGEGPLQKDLQRRIIQLGLEGKAFLVSFDQSVHNIIKDCAMYVTTSDYEGLSNSQMEAMAMGMPVIATDCLGGGARTLIKNGENGLLVPRGDKKSLVCAMKRYIEFPDYAEKCGKNALTIREEYSVESITDKWMSLMK